MTKAPVRVYTGSGKGKTTAALGLALCRAGERKPVYIGQFLKSGDYSETNSIAVFPDLITQETFGSGKFIRGNPSDDDISLAQDGFAKCSEAVLSGRFSLVIMDEANVALSMGLLNFAQVAELIEKKPAETELILTGRKAPAELIEIADITTEMVDIKHYYRRGIPAREGIEK
jgi:cob(I)alamin adenosyltransferase